MKELIITQANTEDAETIVSMHRRLAEHCAYDMSRFNITTQLVEETIANADATSTYYLARGKEQIDGMILCHRVPYGWTGEAGVYIEDLFVEPATRGAGIGKYLIAQACRLATEYADGEPDRAYIRLDTSIEENDATLSFYRNLGMCQNNANFRLGGDALGRLATL